MPKRLLAQVVLAQCSGPLAKAGETLHQQAVSILVTAVLLQNLVADPHAIPEFPSLYTIGGQPTQQVYVRIE
jgi:hypothetical protein